MYSHENKFKLARRGHGDPIGKYPEFINKKTSQIVELKLKKSASTKQKWKYNNFGLTRPTPSITFHPKNIKVGKYK